MNSTVTDITNWLQSKHNHTLYITKTEEHDQDETTLQLQSYEHQQNQALSIDGYGEHHALLLHGHGKITTSGHEAPLPGNAYVIALDGLQGSDVQEDHLILRTNRGTYSITTD
ncbi:hypothetical protein [Paenibacillus sp. JCM 10914]|uniref:hypothetical protein n=1 Tax=Paenibacillus sp. JCM 10914 TaxID=1236974 RepID=UPI0003CC6484|nr:hypothetical protein [Paenibacillus sp. JCM 10914]GAE09078.1 hypothetical protein JCM10914_5420 [Paenibacillus sp. JCM 10914]